MSYQRIENVFNLVVLKITYIKMLLCSHAYFRIKDMFKLKMDWKKLVSYIYLSKLEWEHQIKSREKSNEIENKSKIEMINRVKVRPFERPNKIDNPENANQERYKLLLLRKRVVQWWGISLSGRRHEFCPWPVHHNYKACSPEPESSTVRSPGTTTQSSPNSEKPTRSSERPAQP